MHELELTGKIVDSACRVYDGLGPGLLEGVYELALCHELREHRLEFKKQCLVPTHYRGVNLGVDLRIDLFVEDRIVVELKSVERLEPVHTAQVISYLRLSRRTVGLLINFNVKWLVPDGLKRIVCGFRDSAE